MPSNFFSSPALDLDESEQNTKYKSIISNSSDLVASDDGIDGEASSLLLATSAGRMLPVSYGMVRSADRVATRTVGVSVPTHFFKV